MSPTVKAKVSPTPAKAARAAAERAAEEEAKEIVRERSGGVCEGCGSARATNWAHRVAKGHGGPWDAANGLHLCGMGNASGCHGFSHQKPLEAQALGWIVESHDVDRIREIPVQHAWLGRVLLTSDGRVIPVPD
ncbi:hypothetical protein [Pseudonocardia sp. T1-2H]|uniref:hypothetical protein n=1 Tax=Pseudonocardia sp. T1-2H TaxID=3128899 RepID=UPI003100F76F